MRGRPCKPQQQDNEYKHFLVVARSIVLVSDTNTFLSITLNTVYDAIAGLIHNSTINLATACT